MKKREVFFCLLTTLMTAKQARTETAGAVKAGRAWAFQVGYSFAEEKPAFELEAPVRVTAPGGASYLSSASGDINLEAEGEHLTLTVFFPRTDYFGWDMQAGTSNYRVWIPSGPAANQLAAGRGYSVGAGLNIEIVRKTPVTPRVYSRLAWKTTATRPDRIYFGGENRWESVEDRMDISKVSLGFGTQSSVFGGRVEPAAAFEVFDKRIKLRDLKEGHEAAGARRGWRFSTGAAWRLSPVESVGAELSLRDEQGWRFALEQRF
ncbi:MAG: hypothetical protein HY747_04440 [Elusimicrobia bacterium]|nr:hypothetical protein [Elusimicrobiota bacterium]